MNDEDPTLKTPQLDVIYVNYNSTDCLLTSLASLFRFKTSRFELNVIVVDNASNDAVQRVHHHFPDVRLTANSRNIGFGAAINQALTLCQAPYTILLNPDSLVIDDFLPAVINYMEAYPRVGIVGPMIMDEGGGIQGSARSFPTALTSFFGRNSPITKMYPNNSITRANILTLVSDLTTPMRVDWVSGACMVVRRAAIDQVGGFDERFFLYWEDTDLCRRIKDRGWQIVYLPQARVIHIGGRSSDTRPVFANFHFHKSCYRLYDKYAEWPYSILTPIAGMALMLRFVIAAAINYLRSIVVRLSRPWHAAAAEIKAPADKIRVLRCISRMNIGGPSIHVKNLTEHLYPDRYVTRLLTGTVSACEGDMSYIANFDDTVRRVIFELQREISPYRDLVALVRIVAEMNRFNPDIVHSHTSKAGTIARIAASLYGILKGRRLITIHTFHGHVLDGYFSPSKSIVILFLERMLAMVTDKIIAISSTQKWELSQKYRIAPSRRIATIGLGFDLHPFVNKGVFKGQLRRKLGLPPDTLLIGIVGRIVPIKNHRMFLDAASTFVQQQPSRKVKFVLVGDGELREPLMAYANTIGIAEHTVFYGWERNIPMIYADLDILALTSLNEGTPVSIIEAMAASVPVVTTDVGGIRDLLGGVDADASKGVTFKICQRGILCPTDDAQIFSTALAYMIESGYLSDEDRFARARDYAVTNYSTKRLVGDMAFLYERLIAHRHDH